MPDSSIIARLDNQDRVLGRIEKSIDAIDHTLHGNGAPGLKTEVAKLAQTVGEIQQSRAENRQGWKNLGFGTALSLLGCLVTMLCALYVAMKVPVASAGTPQNQTQSQPK